MMIRERALQSGRYLLALGVFGLLPLVGGCDDSKSTTGQAPPQPAIEQKKEEDARKAAYGGNGVPPSKPGGPAAKPAETKPAESKSEAKPSPK